MRQTRKVIRRSTLTELQAQNAGLRAVVAQLQQRDATQQAAVVQQQEQHAALATRLERLEAVATRAALQASR